MSRRIHGVIAPKNNPPVPARVINVQSRRKSEEQSRIRLDKLLKSSRPTICIKRRLGGIGDVLMTTPLLKAIKTLIPHCHLVYATDLKYSQGALADIILHNPYVDELVKFTEINGNDYDYSVDITTTGLDKEKSGSIPPNRIDMFADAVGVSVDSDPVPIYDVTDEERKKAKRIIEEEFLEGKRREDVNIIVVQAKSNDARRTWPLDKVNQLTKILASDENNIILLFDWGNTAERWKRSDRIFPILNKELPDVAAIVEQSDIVVCPDSSMLHLAGALNKKILTIFGPIPAESRINHYNNASAITLNLSCRPCVVGESQVLTETGYREIQNIKVGDKVFVNSGRLEEVTDVHKNKRETRDLLEIDVFGSYRPLVVTEDHKILISKRTYSWKREDWEGGKRRGVPKLSEPQWVTAKDIKAKDYCCIPIPEVVEPTSTLLKSKDLAWLVGLFVAEGWTKYPSQGSRNYSTLFAISNQETEIENRIREIIKSHPEVFVSDRANNGFVSVEPNSKGESNIVKINNKNFVEELSRLFKICGKINLKNKYIPAEVIHSPDEIAEAFLAGLLKGDGYSSVKDNVFSTAKEDIAYGIQILLAKLKVIAKVYRRDRDTNFKNDSTIYRVYRSKGRDWKRWYIHEKYLLVPVKAISKSTRADEYVWDISVENDPTFTVNNVSVYDCWYSPRCTGSNSSKLECLNKISAETVADAVKQKLSEPYNTEPMIKYGKDISTGGQDPIILVRRTTPGLGDIIMATTGIEALKKKFPTKQIHVACRPEVMTALEGNPYIDEVIDADSAINANRYYMIIDISYPCARYEATRVKMGKPVEKSRVELFAEAIGTRNLIENIKPRYYVTEEEKKYAKKFLKQIAGKKTRKRIALALKSAELYRDWPEDKYGELINKLKEKYQVITLHQTRDFFFEGVVDACGLTFRKAAAILNECDGIITIDSGLLHVASALDIPALALFGPTDYRARCKGYNSIVAVKSDLPCIPCWRNAHIKCEMTGKVKCISRCMELISANKIYKIALSRFK